MQEDNDNANRNFVTCPECKCQVSARRLEEHRFSRCPQNGKIKLQRPPRRPRGRLITRKTLYNTAGNPPISRCRFCGKPSVPGNNACYSCMG